MGTARFYTGTALFTPHHSLGTANKLALAPMTRNRALPDGTLPPYVADYYALRAGAPATADGEALLSRSSPHSDAPVSDDAAAAAAFAALSPPSLGLSSRAPPSSVTLTPRLGAGLLFTESLHPSWEAQGYPRTPGIHTEEQIKAWTEVASAVNGAQDTVTITKNAPTDSEGSSKTSSLTVTRTAPSSPPPRLVFQLMHCGRVANSSNRPLASGPPVAPSAIALTRSVWTDAGGPQKADEPRALDEVDLRRIAEEFYQAAFNAVAVCNASGSELHCGSGYLFHQFLSLSANRRVDKWGGDVGGPGAGAGRGLGRLRFPLSVLEAVAIGSAEGHAKRLADAQAASAASEAAAAAALEEDAVARARSGVSSASSSSHSLLSAGLSGHSQGGAAAVSLLPPLVSLRLTPGSTFNDIDEGTPSVAAELYKALLTEAAATVAAVSLSHGGHGLGQEQGQGIGLVVSASPCSGAPFAEVWRDAFYSKTSHYSSSPGGSSGGAFGVSSSPVDGVPTLVLAGGVRSAPAAAALLRPQLRFTTPDAVAEVYAASEAAPPVASEFGDSPFGEAGDKKDLLSALFSSSPPPSSAGKKKNAYSGFFTSGFGPNASFSAAAAAIMADTAALASLPSPISAAAGLCDAVAVGIPFVANPDLPERLLRGGPLAEAQREVFSSGGRDGFMGWPLWQQQLSQDDDQEGRKVFAF